MKSLLTSIIVVGLAFTLVTAQRPHPEQAEKTLPAEHAIERLDPALDALVSPTAKLELIAGNEHLSFTEGPVWVQEGANGHLLFSDVAANRIYKWTPEGKVSVFLENSGYTGNDPLNAAAQQTSGPIAVLLIGSNGLTLDPQGRLIINAQADRQVVRLEKDGKRTVLADRFDGKRFSGPNDVVVKSNGALYFTDSSAGLRGRDNDPTRELPFYAFYLVKDGKVTMLDNYPQGGIPERFPNGIALSPDEKTLYIGAGSKILRYDIKPDDTVGNGRVFMNVTTDGMKVDQKGNIYTTTHGDVWISSPEGTHLGTIVLPKLQGATSTNIGFGDADGKTLYITARWRMYKVRLNTPGVRPGPR